MMCVFLCCVGSCDVCVHVLCELIVVCGILYCSSLLDGIIIMHARKLIRRNLYLSVVFAA